MVLDSLQYAESACPPWLAQLGTHGTQSHAPDKRAPQACVTEIQVLCEQILGSLGLCLTDPGSLWADTALDPIRSWGKFIISLSLRILVAFTMVFKSLRLLESSRWALTLAGEPSSHAQTFLHHRAAGRQSCVGGPLRSDSFTSHAGLSERGGAESSGLIHSGRWWSLGQDGRKTLFSAECLAPLSFTLKS